MNWAILPEEPNAALLEKLEAEYELNIQGKCTCVICGNVFPETSAIATAEFGLTCFNCYEDLIQTKSQ